MKQFGTVFKKIVNELGEKIYFYDKKEPNILKGSFKNSTKAVFNLEFRDYYIEGQIESNFSDNSDIELGSYFKRESTKNKNYMVISVNEDYLSSGVSYLYATQTNVLVNFQKVKKDKDAKGNNIYLKNEYGSNVPILFYATLRSGKTTNDGNIDQTIYVALAPARFPVSPFDRVIKKGYKNNEYTPINYQVESVNDSMIKIDDKGNITGVIMLQMTLDLRV